MKKATLIISLFLFSCGFLYSQTGDWELQAEIDQVKVYSTKKVTQQDNQDFEYLVLKYVNTSNSGKTIKFKVDLWINDHCRTCKLQSPNEYEYELKLSANETKQGQAGVADKPLSFMSRKADTGSLSKPGGLTKIRITEIE